MTSMLAAKGYCTTQGGLNFKSRDHPVSIIKLAPLSNKRTSLYQNENHLVRSWCLRSRLKFSIAIPRTGKADGSAVALSPAFGHMLLEWDGIKFGFTDI
jgi:hypothetical protein